ncbi:hypothetical protein [Dethiobacter alkaliphilus]|uniref:LPXTG-motif cell wall anchor domain protein n=1 Tax=Dethiobacter alkaliphilus AHT 1 TaxID=555088 RepID=C0GIH0_DETAL|nr:hypothetical protein [Dethiobacter alkaliphilus]EEG76831.1 hypothetical protein DealDRAFT_2279 [Dethiobacter alkaliphilus AHT 1]
MKKTVVMLTVVMLVSLMFTGFALANNTPEGGNPEVIDHGEEDYVGRDMELEKGEMGITAVPGELDEVEEGFVGEGQEPADGEARIISTDADVPEADEDYVGKGMELEEGEMGIVSVDGLEAEEASGNLPLYGGLAVVGGALALFVYRKKIA